MIKRRRKRLRNIRIREVSFVDKPANEMPFLFWKREGSVSVPCWDIDMEKAKNIDLKVSFQSRGSPEDTDISVNGKVLDKPRAFVLSYQKADEENAAIFCEYTIEAKGTDKSGFTSTRTYRLSKNFPGIPSVPGVPDVAEIRGKAKPNPADPEDVETITKFTGTSCEGIEKGLAEALADKISVLDLYITDCPKDFADAIRDVVKLASQTELEVIESLVANEGNMNTEGNMTSTTSGTTATTAQSEAQSQSQQQSANAVSNPGNEASAGNAGSTGNTDSAGNANTSQTSEESDRLVNQIVESLKDKIKVAVKDALAEANSRSQPSGADNENDNGNDEEVSAEEAARILAEATEEALNSI